MPPVNLPMAADGTFQVWTQYDPAVHMFSPKTVMATTKNKMLNLNMFRAGQLVRGYLGFTSAALTLVSGLFLRDIRILAQALSLFTIFDMLLFQFTGLSYINFFMRHVVGQAGAMKLLGCYPGKAGAFKAIGVPLPLLLLLMLYLLLWHAAWSVLCRV